CHALNNGISQFGVWTKVIPGRGGCTVLFCATHARFLTCFGSKTLSDLAPNQHVWRFCAQARPGPSPTDAENLLAPDDRVSHHPAFRRSCSSSRSNASWRRALMQP